mgnify:CR=1 FL=1
MGTRRRVRRMHLNKLTKKNQKRMIEHNDTYNNRWHSKNRTHQAILSYIHSYKYDIDGIYTMTKPEFNKLMKPYRRIKKYIFVVPEDKLHDVLNHEYDLDKNIQIKITPFTSSYTFEFDDFSQLFSINNITKQLKIVFIVYHIKSYGDISSISSSVSIESICLLSLSANVVCLLSDK